MPAYWCRFLDGRGRIISSEKVVAADDAEALAKVHAIIEAENRNGFELLDYAGRVVTGVVSGADQ
jgi:hypothetical protein